MTAIPPQDRRSFVAPDGARWEVRIAARGRASAYLAPKVGRPTLQFTRLDPPAGPPRYAVLTTAGLADLTDDALTALWRGARIY